ncbi:protein PSK SIMULATOR 1-like [Phoenix dactylifera]|uniref:Protein PSK SIMULATOR 1-like n=1 Tax=Phoenix dactylifera TaxID=42345 RepID=A0A8B7CP13_PHODC|nr:protein PSK SIMULATOR 1-like [Phoenix dactylifera]
MVIAKAWFADLRALVGTGAGYDRGLRPDDAPGVVGILAFEAAATMARLVSLHRALCEPEVLHLRSNTMRSQGVAYLNSTDQFLLFRLACAESMDDLDRAAVAISRLGVRCRGALPRGFANIYADLKAGEIIADPDRLGLGSTPKAVEKRVRKMARYVASTARLYAEMELLSELEASERKKEQQWRRYSGPIPMQKPIASDPLRLEIKSQRQRVRRLKEESLWSQSQEKVVDRMAKAAVSVFTRICAVFGQFVPGLPTNRTGLRPRTYPIFTSKYSSGPMERPIPRESNIRNSAPILRTREVMARSCTNWSEQLEAPPGTVGGSGLAQRYANVIVLAERLHLTRAAGDGRVDREKAGEEAALREELYGLLPVGLRVAVRAKLRECWRKDGGVVDEWLAKGWKEAVGRILGWLGPVAHDTVRWQEERNMDRQLRFDTRPRALLLQTLHFSDKEKAEAAIVEVLVGLSCVCWYEERRFDSSRPGFDEHD